MEAIDRLEQINFYNGSENLKIIHLSDIHLWYSTRILKTIESNIVNNNPDLIILTGDYYDIPKGAYNFREFLKIITQIFTVIYIKGNHDDMFGPQISDLLENIPNCYSVENQLFQYQSKTGFRYNITSWNNKHNLPVNENEKNIVLIHNPEKIREEELNNIQLILAGHLHGGQFILFKTKNNSNFPGNLLYKYCTDRRQIKNTTLIVSKGLGDTFPLRYNCPKEIVSILIK